MSPDIYDHIVKETVRYATASKNKLDFVFTVDELKSLIGILLLSSYHKLPSERHYWSKDEDLGVSVVKKAMSRNKFQVLKSVVHFFDNADAENNTGDKGFKNPQLDKSDAIAWGSKVVLKMLEAVADPESHTVFFDNYFTGYELLVHLGNIGFQASGTLRENRLKNCTLKSTNDMKKETRGSYDYRFDTNEEVLMLSKGLSTILALSVPDDHSLKPSAEFLEVPRATASEESLP
ncbi:piggyBac transposable element-derived protein 2-like [Macrobrachium rosenbergii]|uniref:piggyBac transposable element-derived protein 2-like n=1 Tax=Macrobrachium rosenbergii TaxID=79674 RepID=UPI0034D5DF7D